MSEVHLVVKDARDGTAAPCIGTGGVQSEVPFFVLLEVIITGCQYLILTKDTGNLIGAFAGGAQGEDPLHHRRGFIIGDDFFTVLVHLFVAVGRSAAEPLSALCLKLLHRTNLFTGILCVKLVCPISYRAEIVTAFNQRIDAVVDRYEPNSHVREVQFKIITYLQVLSAKSAEILDDQCFHLAALDHILDLFSRGTLEVCSRIAVVGKEQDVIEPIVTGILFEHESLRVNM